MVANFRSYEGQIRLLTSVIAAHPELKLNYKEIATHFGSDWTESGIEHFFRPIKKNGKEIKAMVRRGEDAANFNHNAFQFRAIKKDAENMRNGIEPFGKGIAGDATPATPKSSAPKTPRTAGSRKRSAPSGGKSTTSKKIKESVTKTTHDFTTNLDDDSDEDFSHLTATPSKKRGSANKLYQGSHERVTIDLDTKETPSLQSAQATTPDDEDEIRILTPADVGAAFSFSQSAPNNSQSFSTHSTLWNPENAYVSEPAQESYIADGYEDEC